MQKPITSRICLALVLAAFAVYLHWMEPQNYFGMYHDDSVYLSSAQALAAGRGYVLPSLPGAPAQTKYPVLYPWVLSFVWRGGPGFPANVVTAIGVTVLFACGFLVASFYFLRQLRGVGEWPALACVALCAFHPAFLTLSGAVLSDVPFMALGMAAVLAAERAARSKQGLGAAAIAGLLAGLSAMTRSVGLAVAAGVVVAAAYRRAWRQALTMALAAAPALLYVVTRRPALPVQTAEPGWWQTWLYYTSYVEFWKLSVPSRDVFGAMLSANLKDLLVSPAAMCLIEPPGGENSYAGTLLAVTLTIGILAGVLRETRVHSESFRPSSIHFVLMFYLPLALLWNYPIMKRFLVPFLPLLYAGVWLEGKHIASMIQKTWQAARPRPQKAAAAGFALALTVLAAAAGVQYAVAGRHALRARGEQMAAIEAEQEQAYEWVRRNTPADARFIAIGDVNLYLRTARQAMWPMAFSTAPMYQADSKGLQYQIDHLTDVPRHIGARYWVAADYDYNTTAPAVLERLAHLKSGLPSLFRSTGGRVVIYDISGWLGGPEPVRPPNPPVSTSAISVLR